MLISLSNFFFTTLEFKKSTATTTTTGKGKVMWFSQALQSSDSTQTKSLYSWEPPESAPGSRLQLILWLENKLAGTRPLLRPNSRMAAWVWILSVYSVNVKVRGEQAHLELWWTIRHAFRSCSEAVCFRSAPQLLLFTAEFACFNFQIFFWWSENISFMKFLNLFVWIWKYHQHPNRTAIEDF